MTTPKTLKRTVQTADGHLHLAEGVRLSLGERLRLRSFRERVDEVLHAVNCVLTPEPPTDPGPVPR